MTASSSPADLGVSPVIDLHGRNVQISPADGPLVDSEQGALDLIGDSWQFGADLLVLPVQRLAARFFDLSSGLAGAILQKFVNYRLQVVILGDIDDHLAASEALRAFVLESNSGQHVWFVVDLAELGERLARQERRRFG